MFLVLAVLFACYFLVPILYWLFAAPVTLLMSIAQIHELININRIAVSLALLTLVAPSYCWLVLTLLVLDGTFGEFQLLLTSGYVSVQSSPILMVYAVSLFFVIVPQMFFVGQLWRYYRGTTTRDRTTSTGVISLAFSYALFALSFAWGRTLSLAGALIMLALLSITVAIVLRGNLGATTDGVKVQSDILCMVSCVVLIVAAYVSAQSFISLIIPLPFACVIGLVIMHFFPPSQAQDNAQRTESD